MGLWIRGTQRLETLVEISPSYGTVRDGVEIIGTIRAGVMISGRAEGVGDEVL